MKWWTRRMLLALAPVISAVMLWMHFGGAGSGDPPLRLEVSRSARTLRVYENGQPVRTFGVAVGRPSHPTPEGSYTTGDIEWNPSWTPPKDQAWARDRTYQPPGAAANPMQAVKIYFKAPYYFIHGTNDPGSIGEAASHGCIRMTPDDATDLAHMIESAGGHVPLRISD
jgi:lipoprotein-anchoring transpeptidase ErfK/SrfK